VLYGSDLAHAHDDGFGFLARAGAAELTQALGTAGIGAGLVVDLACGTGITAKLLNDAGYDVLGVDLSPDALTIARERAPSARFEEGSLHDFEPPPCVAVTAIGEGLNYTADSRAGREAAAALFERAHAALEPEGTLLFDVATPGRESPDPRRSWHEGDDWLVCLEAWEEPDGRKLHRRIATFRRRAAGSWRRGDELHTLRLLDPNELLADLTATGFEGRQLAGYGGEYRFGRGHAGFTARA
jgi:SAM-dependent methyltransferase